MLVLALAMMTPCTIRDVRIPSAIQHVLQNLPPTSVMVFESRANPDPQRLHVHVITQWSSALGAHLRELGFRDEAFDAFYLATPEDRFQYLAWCEPAPAATPR